MTTEKYTRPTIPTHEEITEERQRIRRDQAFIKAMRSTVAVLVVVAALAVLIATLFLPVLQVAGTSMEPTLEDGDVILLVKTKDFETGDLIGLHYEGKILLKRVIGGPGDFIFIDKDGTVSVNNVELEEPYVTDKSLGECDISFPYQVPADAYFVLGDHRSVSVDSRSTVVGCIQYEQIIGRVVVRIWPLSELSWIF